MPQQRPDTARKKKKRKIVLNLFSEKVDQFSLTLHYPSLRGKVGEGRLSCVRLRVKEKSGNCLAAVGVLMSLVENTPGMTGLCFDGREQESMGTSTEKTRYVDRPPHRVCVGMGLDDDDGDDDDDYNEHF